jgi:hypothetical protein
MNTLEYVYIHISHFRHECLVCVCVYSVCVVLCFDSDLANACDELITRPKKSYRLWKMITELNRRPGPWMGWKSHWIYTYVLVYLSNTTINKINSFSLYRVNWIFIGLKYNVATRFASHGTIIRRYSLQILNYWVVGLVSPDDGFMRGETCCDVILQSNKDSVDTIEWKWVIFIDSCVWQVYQNKCIYTVINTQHDAYLEDVRIRVFSDEMLWRL